MAKTLKIDDRLKINYELKNRNEIETLLSTTFTFCRKRYKVSLGVKVPPPYWKVEERRIKIDPDLTQILQRKYKKVNRFLSSFEEELKSITIGDSKEAHERNPDLVAQLIKVRVDVLHNKEIKAEEKKNISVLDYFQKLIDEMPNKFIKRSGKFIEDKTIGHHKIVKKRVERFFQYKNWGKGQWQLFNSGYETAMEKWMLGVEEYTPNTVCATFSVMKVWLNKAEEEGLIIDKSFHSWKSKGYDVKHVYLNEEEIDRIYRLDFSEIKKLHPNTSIELSRDIFILSASLGLRYGDLTHIHNFNWDIENGVVEVHTKKTGKTVKIPTSTKVIEIYKKYDGQIPNVIDKSHYNTHIRKFCKMAGIEQTINMKENVGGKVLIVEKKKYELISSHTARRSFATNLYKKSKDARMVMNFTGHQTEQSFRKYICWEEEEILERAREYFD